MGYFKVLVSAFAFFSIVFTGCDGKYLPKAQNDSCFIVMGKGEGLQQNDYLKIDNVLKFAKAAGQVDIETCSNDYVLDINEDFKDIFNTDNWNNKLAESPLELSPSIILYIPSGEEEKNIEVRFYDTEDLSMIIFDGYFKYYTIPKNTYTNLEKYILKNGISFDD